MVLILRFPRERADRSIKSWVQSFWSRRKESPYFVIDFGFNESYKPPLAQFLILVRACNVANNSRSRNNWYILAARFLGTNESCQDYDEAAPHDSRDKCNWVFLACQHVVHGVAFATFRTQRKSPLIGMEDNSFNPPAFDVVVCGRDPGREHWYIYFLCALSRKDKGYPGNGDAAHRHSRYMC